VLFVFHAFLIPFFLEPCASLHIFPMNSKSENPLSPEFEILLLAVSDDHPLPVLLIFSFL